jgi:hypothetical protein
MPILTYIYVGTIVIGLVICGFWGEWRYTAGEEAQRVKHMDAVVQHDQTMAKLRRQHENELAKIASQHQRQATEDQKRIRTLIVENHALRDWWNSGLPPAVVEFIWVPDSDSHKSLSRGHDTGGDNQSTVKTRSPS